MVLIFGAATLKTIAGSSIASGSPANISLLVNVDPKATVGTGPISISNSTLNASTSGTQSAGEIALTASQIAVNNSALSVSTSNSGNAGDIRFLTAGVVAVSGANTSITSDSSAVGSSGDIQFGLGENPIASLAVSGGATISVNASGAGPLAGNGGALVVTSSGPVTVSGAGTTLSSNSSHDAKGGSIEILAASLAMTGGAVVSANTSSNASGAASSPAGSGMLVHAAAQNPVVTGGSVTVTTTGSISLDGAGTEISAKATGSGSGGTVSITSTSLSLTNGASVATTASGTGNSGNISATLYPIMPGAHPGPGVFITGNSAITTFSDISTGGNITILPGGNPLTMRNSSIRASAGGSGDGGDITIGVTPETGTTVSATGGVGLTILQNSGIVAQANNGDGGVININLIPGGLFVQDSQSLVSASSAAGNNGEVTILSPQLNFNSALAVPAVSTSRAPELSSNACRRSSGRSTFVRDGHGGLPPAPDSYLYANSALESEGTLSGPNRPRSAVKSDGLLAAAFTDVDCK